MRTIHTLHATIASLTTKPTAKSALTSNIKLASKLKTALSPKVVIATILSGSLLLTACQKAEDDSAQADLTSTAETDTQPANDKTAQTADTSDATEAPEHLANPNTAIDTDPLQQAQPDVPMQSTANMSAEHSGSNSPQRLYPYHLTQDNANVANVDVNGNASNAQPSQPSTTTSPQPNVATASTNQTIDYQDDQGRSMQVSYQASVNSELYASLTLPSGKQILLSAPASQSKNATYRSVDGSIELMTGQNRRSIEVRFEGQSVTLNAKS